MSLQERLGSFGNFVLDTEEPDSLGLHGDDVVRFVGRVLHRRITTFCFPVEFLFLPLDHILVVGQGPLGDLDALGRSASVHFGIQVLSVALEVEVGSRFGCAVEEVRHVLEPDQDLVPSLWQQVQLEVLDFAKQVSGGVILNCCSRSGRF